MFIKDKIGFYVFLTVLLFSSWYIHMGLSTNDASRYSLTKSIATRGTLSVDGVLDELIGRARAVDRAKYKGKTYSDKAPLGGLIGVIPYYIINKIFNKNSHRPFRVWFVTLFMSSLPAAFTAWLFYKLALLYETKKPLAAFLSISLILGTNLYFWATLMFSQTLTTCMITAAIYFLKSNHKYKFFLCGIFAGLSVSSDYYVFLFLPIFFIYIAFLHKKQVGFWVLGAFIAGLIPMTYHYVIFGNPFTLPYLHQENFGDYHNKGFYGAQSFSFRRLANILFGSKFGLFFYSPILFGSLFLMPAFYKKHKHDMFFLGSIIIILFAFTSSLGLVDRAGYGFGWGPRYIAPLFPIFFLFYTQLERKHLKLFFILSAFSIILNYYIVNLMALPPWDKSIEYLKDYKVLGYAGGFSSMAQYFFYTNNAKPLLMAFFNSLLVVITGIFWYYCIRDFNKIEENIEDAPTPV